jgi:riboflavin kinase/FMN adenylyltransferase
VREAHGLLGRPYRIDGRVVRGDGRGRGIGVPTANIEPENEILPELGVYAGRVALDDQPAVRHPAVVNLGRRPTFAGQETVLEAHLLRYGGDLYGRRLRLELLARLREERRFESVEALVAQIRKDAAAAEAVLR